MTTDQLARRARGLVPLGAMIAVASLEAGLSGAIATDLALSTPQVSSAVDGRLSELTFAGPPLWASILGGLVVALLVWAVQRQLALATDGLRGRRLIGPLVVRGLLSTLIGLVMSTPLVLQIFDAEVKQEMVNIQAENASKQAQGVEKLRVQLRVLEDAVVQRQIELDSAKAGLNLEANPTYQDANKAYVAAQKDCDEKSRLAGLEAIGQLPPPQGSGKHGDGRVYQALVEARDAACRIKTEKKNALDKLVTSLQTESEAGRAAKIKSAQEALDAAIASAEHMRTTLKTSGDFAQASSAGAWGLRTRLAALGQVLTPGTSLSAQPGASTAVSYLGPVGIVILLASIQVLPMLAIMPGRAPADVAAVEERLSTPGRNDR